MFAVIKTGGKQYRVSADDVIQVEKLPAEAGSEVSFAEVLMIGDGDTATVGTPLVAGASVSGEVVEQTRGDKIRVFKKKRRKGYRRTAGHRQHLTVVKITEILADGKKKKAKKAAEAPAKEEAPAVEEAAAETPAPEATATDTAAPAEAAPAPAEAPADETPKADTPAEKDK